MSDETNRETTAPAGHHTYRCANCGAAVEFDPASSALKCPYCGAEQTIDGLERSAGEELDYHSAIERFAAMASEEVRIIRCGACSGESTLEPNIESAACHFCGTPLVVTGPTSKAMKPQYLVPFSVPREAANTAFGAWVTKRWFAPNKLKQYAGRGEGLKGIYFPFWTFDSQTYSHYTGRRGDNYTVTVQSKDAQGNPTTRTETRVRWRPASGRVSRFFDDVLVPGSRNLPDKLTRKFRTFDTKSLVAYNPAVQAGFTAESYSVGIEEGFEDAKEIMDEQIRADVRRDIGGDHQEIHSLSTHYEDIGFKYLQLPVWTLTYRFGKKIYQVLVNGQTGEVVGTRPWSWVKILLASLGGATLIAAIVLLIQYLQ